MQVLFISIFIISVSAWLFAGNIYLRWLSIFSLAALMVAWRISSWQHPRYLCIDEAEWLALAGRIKDCPVPFQCYNCSTSGFLSIGLLNVLPAIGLDLSYFNLRVFGFILCIIPATVLCYYGIRKWYNSIVAKQVFPWLAMFMIFSFYNREFLSYNTEYLLMVLYATVFYLYASWKQSNFSNMREPIGIAILLGVLPYFKLQSVPFVFAFYVILLYSSFRRRYWLNMVSWHLAMLSPSLIFFIYFLWHNAIYDFYKMYIEANAYYVNHRITSYKYSDNEFVHRLRAFKGMHLTTFSPLYIGLIPIVLINFKEIISKRHFGIGKTFVWVFLMVCYSTFTTGNGFGHYNILLIVPYTYLLANLYYNLNLDLISINKWLTLTGVTITSIIYINKTEEYPLQPFLSNNETEKYISSACTGGEPVLFLGYTEALEAQIRIGLKLPVRNATSHYITIKDSSLRRYFQDGFFQDMNISRPRYVLDMEEVLEMPGLQPVKTFILAHYSVDSMIEGNVIYKLKN